MKNDPSIDSLDETELREMAAEVLEQVQQLLKDWPSASRKQRREKTLKVLEGARSDLEGELTVEELAEMVETLQKVLNESRLQQTSFQLELSEKIRDAQRIERGFLPMENAIRIAASTPEGSPPPITRKQLQKLAYGEDLPLRFQQMDALDRYFRSKGLRTLARMLEPPTALRRMAEGGRIACVFGSQPNQKEKRISLSRWDVKGMQAIQRALYATGIPAQVALMDVIFRGELATRFKDPSTVGENEEWYHLVQRPNLRGDSVVILGSPKANHGAEVVISRMLDVEPFELWPKDRIDERPFAFAWHQVDHRAHRMHSCLNLGIEDAERVKLENEDDREYLRRLIAGDAAVARDSAVIANGKVHRIARTNRSEQQWKSYGIIAVRKFRHRAFACIMGATGPATMAAARLFAQFAPDLSGTEEPGRTAWCLVEVIVEDETVGVPKTENFRADERRIVDQRILDQGIFYYPG